MADEVVVPFDVRVPGEDFTNMYRAVNFFFNNFMEVPEAMGVSEDEVMTVLRVLFCLMFCTELHRRGGGRGGGGYYIYI